MLQWEGRIVDNTNVQLLKAALPYLDQPVGNRIDLEGLLRSIRVFCRKNERQIIDLLLQIFMFRHVREMMTMMQEMKQEAEQSDSGTGNMEGMMEFLKSRIPPEQQDMVDMMSVFLSAMSEDNNGQSGRDAKMNPAKAKILKQLEAQTKGIEMKAAAPFVMQAMRELRSRNLSFTPEETEAMMEILTRDMNDSEKQRVEKMKQIIRTKGNK